MCWIVQAIQPRRVLDTTHSLNFWELRASVVLNQLSFPAVLKWELCRTEHKKTIKKKAKSPPTLHHHPFCITSGFHPPSLNLRGPNLTLSLKLFNPVSIITLCMKNILLHLRSSFHWVICVWLRKTFPPQNPTLCIGQWLLLWDHFSGLFLALHCNVPLEKHCKLGGKNNFCCYTSA